MKDIEMIVGSIRDLNSDKEAFWMMYQNKDNECERLKKEIERLKKRLKKHER